MSQPKKIHAVDADPPTDAEIRWDIVDGVEAEHVTVRQGAAMRMNAVRADISQGAVAKLETGEAKLEGSSVMVASCQSDVTIDQSAAGLVVGRGEVTMDQCATIGVVGKTVNAKDTTAVFVIANRIEGKIETSFGLREALLFGVAAGATLALGAFLLPRAAVALGALALRGKRRKQLTNGTSDKT